MIKRHFSKKLPNGSLVDHYILKHVVICLRICWKLEGSYWLVVNLRKVTARNYKSQHAVVHRDQRGIIGDDDIFMLIKRILLSSKSFSVLPAHHKGLTIMHPTWRWIRRGEEVKVLGLDTESCHRRKPLDPTLAHQVDGLRFQLPNESSVQITLPCNRCVLGEIIYIKPPADHILQIPGSHCLPETVTVLLRETSKKGFHVKAVVKEPNTRKTGKIKKH